MKRPNWEFCLWVRSLEDGAEAGMERLNLYLHGRINAFELAPNLRIAVAGFTAQ